MIEDEKFIQLDIKLHSFTVKEKKRSELIGSDSHTHASFPSVHAQQAVQRLGNRYQTVGSTDQRAPPCRDLRSRGTQAAMGQSQHHISS